MSHRASSSAIAYVVGARPNYVKMAPLIRQLLLVAPELDHVLINTGQHYDPEMSAIFLEELALGEPDFQLAVGSGSHGAQTGCALERIEQALLEVRPSALVVPGDVNSTLAGALAACKLNIPVAHLEAGLRSFDRTMPEEINRVLTDQVSRWCLTHSPEAEANLLHEGIEGERIAFVGNTMIDSLVWVGPRVEESTILERIGVEAGGYVLMTLHRPSLVDGDAFGAVVEAVRRLATHLPVVFPVHPRTRARLGYDPRSPDQLLVIDPVGYVDFLALETGARAVVTDSGGVQEETTFLGVPCFTMRDNTERPVTVTLGTNQLIGTRPEALDAIPSLLGETRSRRPPPEGWDGRASERAASVILAGLEDARDDIRARAVS